MVETAGGVGESASEGARGIGQGLSSKIGPLPVWGWLAVLGVGGALVYVFVIRKGGAGSAYSGFGFPTGGGGGGGSTSGGGASTAAAPTDNSAWLSNAIAGATTGLGLSEGEVAYYLREYLSGNVPTGSNQAYSTFQKVVDYATQNFGLPPISPSSGSPGTSYYTTQQNWFNDVLAFLPSGTSDSVTQELKALFAGTTTTISQDAANAYNAAVAVIGLGPTGGLNFTITGAPGAAPPAAATVTAAQITSWQSAFFAGVQDFSHWISAAPAALQSGFSSAQQQQIYNYFAAQGANGVKYTTQQIVDMINGWLANPASIPAVPPVKTTVVPPGTGGH